MSPGRVGPPSLCPAGTLPGRRLPGRQCPAPRLQGDPGLGPSKAAGLGRWHRPGRGPWALGGGGSVLGCVSSGQALPAAGTDLRPSLSGQTSFQREAMPLTRDPYDCSAPTGQNVGAAGTPKRSPTAQPAQHWLSCLGCHPEQPGYWVETGTSMERSLSPAEPACCPGRWEFPLQLQAPGTPCVPGR